MDSDFDSAQWANIVQFGRELDSLLKTAFGKFVVFRDARLVKTFASREAALRYGYEHYGRTAFLVQQIAPLPSGLDDSPRAWRA